MKKLDIHVHATLKKVTNRIGQNTSYTTADELLVMYEKLDIDKGVLLPEINPKYSTHIQSNEEVIEIIDKFPESFFWFCNVDPRMGFNNPQTDLSHFINYYKAYGAKGVGEIQSNLYFDDPLVENLFCHCEKCRMPVIFHIAPQFGNCYGLIDELGLYRLEKELSKYYGWMRH